MGAPPEPSLSAGAGARGIVLLVIAVALGIGLLQAFDDGADPYDAVVGTDAGESVTTLPSAVVTSPPTTVRPARAAAEVRVLPVNGTRTQGLGKKTGDLLKAAGYNILAPVDTQGGRLLETSAVQFAADYEAEARAIAELLGLNPSAVQPLSSPPVSDTREANVVVLIGPELTRLASASTTTTLATTSTTRS